MEIKGKKRLLVTEELVKFEKQPVGVQDLWKITHIIVSEKSVEDTLNGGRKSWKIVTRNRLELETLGFRLTKLCP